MTANHIDHQKTGRGQIEVSPPGFANREEPGKREVGALLSDVFFFSLHNGAKIDRQNFPIKNTISPCRYFYRQKYLAKFAYMEQERTVQAVPSALVLYDKT